MAVQYSAKPQPDNMKAQPSRSVDIKGAITLAVFVTSFLVALTLVETEELWSDKMALFLSAGAFHLRFLSLLKGGPRNPSWTFD